MADPYSELIAAMISSKGGSDFSSNTMDPVMQYLLGNYQSAPQFTQDDLYSRLAPNIQAANNSRNPAFKQAADMIRSGTPSWELWTDDELINSSGLKPSEWKSFVESLAKEQQDVLKSTMDQGMQQDVFQKAGMRGASETYLDTNPDGSLKNVASAYKFAPQQFDALLGDLPQRESSDAARNKAIDAKYGVAMVTDDEKKKKMLYELALSRLSEEERKRFEKDTRFARDKNGSLLPLLNKPGDGRGGIVGGALKSAITNPFSSLLGTKPLLERFLISAGLHGPADMTGAAMTEASKGLKANPGGVEDKSATSRNKSYANVLKSLADRTAGSAADTNRRAQEAAFQILSSLNAQGATPLKDDILSNAMLKRTTRNG